MPIYSLQGPDGRLYKVEAPEGAQQEDLIAFVEQNLAQQPKPFGMGEKIKQGFGRGLESLISTGVTAAGSTFGSPEEAAKAGLERREQIQQKYPHQYGLEQFKQTYQDQGLFPAATQFAGEIPAAIAEQVPNIGATIGGSILGSAIGGVRAGATFGPWGAAIGGIGGALLPSLMQQFGGNIERQAQEQTEAGQPLNINRSSAFQAALPQAGLDVAATFIPLGGRLVSKITGIPVDALIGRTAAQTAKLAEEGLMKTLAKGTAVGALAEIPTEVTQQMLERWQAGLPLADEEAYKEYGETAFKVSMLAPIGAVGRLSDRSGARQEVERTAQEEQIRLATEQKAEQDRIQAAQAQRDAEELQRMEEYKQTPEYAEEIATKYQQAEKAKADLLAQIRPVQQGSMTATADTLFNKSIEEQAAAMQPEIDRLAKEYNDSPQPPPLEEQTFTPEQYQQAVATLASTIKDQQVAAPDAINMVKQATGIDNDQYASSLLDAATQQGDIVVDEATGTIGIPSEKEGFKIEQGFEEKEQKPTGFNVVRGDKVVSSSPDEKAAQTKLASLEKTRVNALGKITQQSQLASQKLANSQGLLKNMEASGKQDTPEYAKAVQKHEALSQKVANKLAELGAKQQELLTPFAVKPSGYKKIGRKTFTVKEEGVDQKPFYKREAAEKAALSKVSDERLNEIATKSKSPKIVEKVRAEIERRQQAAAPKVSPVNSAVAQALRDSLSPMLKKFGLEEVSLEMANDIANNAEGSYAAKLIRIALDASNPVRVLRHESVHALKELGFFSPSQWKALEAQAKKVWVNKYLQNKAVDFQGQTVSRLDAYKSMGLSQADILEEAIADAFADFDINKAPAGFLASMLNKLRSFFAALGNAMRGAGFTTAEDIFGKIEGGRLKPAQKLTNQTMQQRFSLLRSAYPDEIEISTQNPQGVTRKYDPISQMLSIDSAAVDEAMNANTDIRDRIVQAISSYGFIPKNTPKDQVLDVFKKNIVNNLIFLHNKVPKKIRDRSKLWYDGANVIAEQMAAEYGMTLRQVAGIMAAMSPQKDWFQNVSMAERAIDILTNQGESTWTPEMLRYADSYVNETKDRAEREKRQEHRDQIQKIADSGTMLQDMDAKDAAAFIRAYDEAFNSRQYRIVTPEGGFGELVRNNDGTPSTMMWSTYGPIEKTVNIFRDGSRQNVSQQLGFEHKIRSFYNNISAPNSDIGHVTIDTHAVAAALFEALAGTDTEVTQNFGGTGKSDVLGVGGTYGLIADAYREAAASLGLKPRELQSITWEAVRSLFSEEMKSTLKPKVRAEWQKYRDGLQTFGAVRRNVLRLAGQDKKLDEPDWIGSGAGQTVEEGGASYDKDYVPEGGVRLRSANELIERASVNLSAATDLLTLPGVKELYNRSRNGDVAAYKLLQDIAANSLKYLLNDTKARITVKPIKGVYMSNREPALMASVTFKESESADVLARLARFAKNYDQEQVHVRVKTNKKLGHQFEDGSYATASYTIDIDKNLSDADINDLIAKTGLQAFSVDKDSITTYWVAPNDISKSDQEQNFKEFAAAIKTLNGLVGRSGKQAKQRIERLYVYGDAGYGRRIGFSDIQRDIPAKAKPDLATPRMIAEYLFRNPVKVFNQKSLTLDQQSQQKLLARVFNDLPLNDLKKPLVRKAYEALNRELLQQFQVLPIKVELQTKTYRSEDEIPAKFKGKFKAGDLIPPYSNLSSEMRRDISENNHLLVYPTSPDSFGPKGSDFSNHPLLQPSGLKDSLGNDLLFNDVLRAVHDYYAHGLAEAQFGPAGEYTAWANHMAATADPMARWALTAETRLQNAWQNFNAGHEKLPVADRPYAEQKAALPPVNFLLTGDKAVDAPVLEMIQKLNEKQVLGSLKERSKAADEVFKRLEKAAPPKAGEKLSLREVVQDGLASWTPKRIKYLVDDFGYTDGRTKGYAAWVNPRDFIKATTLGDSDYLRIFEEAGPLREDEIKANSLPPRLYVEGDNWKISGHEGRHRMAGLAAAGVKKTPVLLVMRENGYTTGAKRQPFAEKVLGGQKFEMGRGKDVFVEDLTPLTYEYTKELADKFGKDSQVRYSLREAPQTRDEKFKQTGEAQRYGIGVDSKMSPEDLGTQFSYGGRLQALLEHVGDLVNRAAMPSDPSQSGAGVGGGGVPYGLESMREKVGRALRDLGRTDSSEYTDQIKRNAEYYVKEGEFQSSEKYISEANTWLKNYADAYKQIPVHTKLQELSRNAAVDLGRKDFVAAKRKLMQLEEMINSDQAEQHYEDVASQKQQPKFSLRDKLGMYSELENKIAAASPQAPVETWKGFIKSLPTKGVKPEEIEWSGVNDWLDLQKGKVTRQEVLDYLKQGGVKVEETVLGEMDTSRIDIVPSVDGWNLIGPTGEVIDSYPPGDMGLEDAQVKSQFRPEGKFSLRAQIFGARDNIKKNNSDLYKAQKELEALSKAFWIDRSISSEEFRPKQSELQSKIVELERLNKRWQETLPPGREAEIHPGFTKIPLGTEVLTTRRGELERATVRENRQVQYGDETTWYPRVEFSDGEMKRLTSNDIKKVLRDPFKFSLRAQILATPNGQAIMDTIDRTTTARQEKGYIESFFSWLKPDNFSKIRQEVLNRYEALGVNEKRLAKRMGGIERLADSNAESAALMSDLAAGVSYSAFGMDDKVGGIPVYRNGHTFISNEQNTVKGPFAIFAPLAKYNDPLIYQMWQTWAGSKRASRFLANGTEQNYTAAEIAQAQQLGAMYPEFQTVHDEWIKYNDGLVKYLVDTGVLSAENGQKFRQHSDYIPFYRQIDGEQTVGPQIFQALSGVSAPRRIKGSDAPIADFFETIVRNTQAAIQAGMKNTAAVKAVETAEILGDAQQLNTVSSAPNTVTVLKNGLKVSYQVRDILFLDAMKSLNMSEIPFLSIIAAPANLLRSLITKEPGFILANLMRDSMSAYATSGVKMTNIAGVVSNFGQDLFSRSDEAKILRSVGISTGYEFAEGPRAGGDTFKQALMAKSGKKSVTGMPVRGIKSLWGYLEKVSEASDLATRIAVYKDTLARTGNEAEAKFSALAMMNFNRRGRSPAVRLLTAAIPFLNARMQGLDVFYRAGIRPFFSKTNPTAYEKQIQKAFMQRGLLLAALSVFYAASVSGDEDYEKQEEETKDNYWLLPSLGIKIPIPHEVGFLFKTIPERIYRASFGTDTTKDLGKSLYRGVTSTLGFNPIPQAVLPLTEAIVNYSFFTNRAIVGSALSDIDPRFQVGPSTSLLSQMVGKSTGLSPMKLDHIIKGYTGTMGMYMADVLDSVIDSYSDVQKPSKRFEQTPVLRRFLVDPEARGNVTAYYDLKDSVDETVRTINLMEKTGNPELAGYIEENAKKFAIKGYVNNLNEQMKSLQQQALLIRSSTLKPDEKMELLKEIGRAQNALSNDIKYVRKLVTEE